MRKVAFLLLSISLLALMAGCSGSETPAADPTPTIDTSPTTETETGSEDLATPETIPASPTPSGPATCEPFTLTVESDIPPVTEDDHVYGPEDAPITFIEYADFQCPACSQLHTMREFLESRYGDQIRFVYRHLPLTEIHDKAIITAEAAEAAAAQGKFWEMHDLLYEKIQEWNNLPEEELIDKLVDYAEELELDTDQFSQEMEDHVYREEIQAAYEEYQEYAGQEHMATPTYVINNVFYPTRQLGGFERLEGFIGLINMQDKMYESGPEEVIDPEKDYTATIRTSKGDIVIELFTEEAPVNANSFAFLAEDGWYDGQDFFFVDQEALALTGDPTNTGAGLPYSGYQCDNEISPDLTFDKPGMVGLAPSGPATSSSSFFITFASQAEFTGNITIIGEVIEGMEVAQKLNEVQPGSDQEADTLETIVIEEQ